MSKPMNPPAESVSQLQGVPATLLISLNARCHESSHPRGLINDPMSIEITRQLGYDFRRERSFLFTNVGTGIRTVVFNRYTEDFMRRYPDGTVVNLACGLDTRFHRLDNGRVRWFDLDLPEVIDIRRRFFNETDRYRFIVASALDPTWFEQVPKDRPVFFTAEGLFCYFTEEQVRTLLTTVATAFPRAEFVIEAIARYMVKGSEHHPSLKGYDASFTWGVDSGRELDTWQTGFRFVDEQYFMSLPECKRRSLLVRLFCFVPKFARSMKIFRLRNYDEP